MRTTSSRLNREEQVKVVIRLKPQEQQNMSNNSVYLSEQENQLVVATDHKKEIFVFDHVAHQCTSQLEIYRMIAQEAVESSLEGYNCCLFAYGQTGTGKTYSIMGDINELQSDFYCQSRGILPRLIQDIFQLTALQTESTYKITCSYIQIYNQQIFDLLSTDKRVHSIREDHRKGVFVEGVVQKRLTSYKQGIDALIEGDKSRKISYTTMNTESSRSHVIFTLIIESQSKQDELIKIKKSKLNIVDLAGSERVKHTNVEGERLRQGCNINKSLHVLGNVINSLVESTKKKKHIPYRDSKLTYYLKDSLGGNSITKLLANIHCGRQYLGDTISTLMFAKRAKILKTRVEQNENLTENFDHLRKEVRRLRQQLAQAKYFKDVQKSQRSSFYQDFQQTLQKITDNSDYEVAPKLDIIQVFEENQLHYKSLIEVYEQHMKICGSNTNTSQIRRNSLNLLGQWKNNEKKNLALTNLVKQFPAFTKIYKENILLKGQKQKSRAYDEALVSSRKQKPISRKIGDQTTFITFKEPQSIETASVQETIRIYERLIDQMSMTFRKAFQSLQKSFIELEKQLKIKDRRIKDLIRAQDLPPDVEQLRNENEYLHLNILELQNEIKQLREYENQLKLSFQLKDKKLSHRSSIKEKEKDQVDDQQTMLFVLDELTRIKQEAQKQAEIAEKQRQQMQTTIHRLQTQINSLINENNKLHLKQNRGGSQKKPREMYQSHYFINSDEKPSHKNFRMPQDYNTKSKNTISLQNELKEAEANYTKELMTLRLEIKMNHKQLVDLKQQLKKFEQSDKKIEQQFGASLDTVIKGYRESLKKQKVSQSKSTKSINKQKQSHPILLNVNREKIIQKKLGDICIPINKDVMRNSSRKETQVNNYFSNSSNKPKGNSFK